MKWYSKYEDSQGRRFIIDEDSDVGFYLYVYEVRGFFDKDLKEEGCPRHQQDHLQDTLEMAQEQALEDFGVPLDSWRKVPSP